MRRETEQKRKQGDNPLLSIVNDPTFSSEPTEVGSFSLPHSRLDSRAGKHRVFRRVKMDQSSHGRTKVMAERAHDVKSEEDWSEASSSVGSMKLEELVPAPTSSTAHTPVRLCTVYSSLAAFVQENGLANFWHIMRLCF